MTLAHKVKNEINAFANFQSGSKVIEVQEAHRRLTCEINALDSLACTTSRLALQTTALAEASMDRIKQISESLASRLTYLLEPISPIEADAEKCVVQLRSNPPQKDSDGSTYFELLVERGGQLSLVRYQKSSGEPRRVIPAQLTREVLFRLIDDFTAAVE